MDKKGNKKGNKKGKGEEQDRAEQEKKILKGMNCQQLKIKINEQRQRVNELVGQLHGVDAEVKGESRKTLRQNYEAEKEIQEKEERVHLLEDQLVRARQANALELEQFRAQAERDLEGLIGRLQREAVTPRQRLREVADKIASLKDFLADEFHCQTRKEALERRITESKLKQEEELKKLTKKYEHEKKLLEEENIDEYKRIKAEQLLDAQLKMGLYESRTKLENKALQEQIELYGGEVAVVRQEIEALRASISAHRESIAADEQTRKGLMLETHKSNSKIKRLKEKEKQFQLHIVREAGRVGASLNDTEAQGNQRTQALAYKIRSCDELLRIKSKELATLKNLCQLVLDQRSSVEQYFIEVLLAESPALDLDVARLAEEDRDRMLRQLFIKINSGAPPVNWREYEDEA
jgi:hypothetical protein